MPSGGPAAPHCHPRPAGLPSPPEDAPPPLPGRTPSGPQSSNHTFSWQDADGLSQEAPCLWLRLLKGNGHVLVIQSRHWTQNEGATNSKSREDKVPIDRHLHKSIETTFPSVMKCVSYAPLQSAIPREGWSSKVKASPVKAPV